MFGVSCRLLSHAPAVGSWNMAVDQALLESTAVSGEATLRFYRWSRPTLSLGYFQRSADRATHAKSVACDLVRRSTGGGAIVHDDELTYSLAVPHIGNVRRPAEQLYTRVHDALIAALGEAGVHAALYSDSIVARDAEPPFLCFERRAANDVVIGNEKIAGSAQRRRAGAVLQHGSVLLGRSSAAPQLLGIEQIADRRLNGPQLVECWLPFLAQNLGYDFRPGELSATESAAVTQIEQTRYANVQWTSRR